MQEIVFSIRGMNRRSVLWVIDAGGPAAAGLAACVGLAWTMAVSRETSNHGARAESFE